MACSSESLSRRIRTKGLIGKTPQKLESEWCSSRSQDYNAHAMVAAGLAGLEPGKIDEMTKRMSSDQRQRLDLLVYAYQSGVSHLDDPATIEEMLGHLSGARAFDSLAYNVYFVLSKSTVPESKLSEALTGVYAAEQDPWKRVRLIEEVSRAGDWRTSITPVSFLGNVIKDPGQVLPRIHAGQAYLQAADSVPQDVMQSLTGIVGKAAIGRIDADLLAADANSARAFARLIGSYLFSAPANRRPGKCAAA